MNSITIWIGLFVISIINVTAQDMLTIDETRHLLTRTGFGASADDFKTYGNLSKEQAVDKIINGLRTEAITPVPQIVTQPIAKTYDSLIHDKYTMDVSDNVYHGTIPAGVKLEGNFWFIVNNERYHITSWWWQEIINTPSPMTEHMTLFWHEHFPVVFGAWGIPLLEYNQILRKHGTTNFKDLAVGMLKNPAMLHFLNNTENIATNPNENLGREFLELFTMGEGNYTDHDVKALSKILAGHGVDYKTGNYVFNEELSYKEPVTFLGKTAVFTLDEAVDLVLDNQKVPEFIVTKLWREFIAPNPSEMVVKELAQEFIAHNYDIKHLLSKLLLHDEFWDQKNRGVLVKSPVELIAGTVRSFGIWTATPFLFMEDSKLLEQDLLTPPSVDGWPEHLEWINSHTLTLRNLVMDRLWNAHDNFKNLNTLEKGYKDGLTVCVSSQMLNMNRDNPAFKLYINDTLFREYKTKYPDIKRGFTNLNMIPQPEYLYFPKEELPPMINTIKVVFDNSYTSYGEDEFRKNDNSLFVHWMQYDGIFYQTRKAKTSFYDHPELNESVPVGLLYHDGELVVDFKEIREKFLVENTNPYMEYHLDTPLIAQAYSQGITEYFEMKPSTKELPDLKRSDNFMVAVLDQKNLKQSTAFPTLAVVPKDIALPKNITTTDKSYTENVLRFLTKNPSYHLK